MVMLYTQRCQCALVGSDNFTESHPVGGIVSVTCLLWWAFGFYLISSLHCHKHVCIKFQKHAEVRFLIVKFLDLRVCALRFL